MGLPFSQHVDADVLAPLAPPVATVPPFDEVLVVPAFCDVCERAPGDSGPGWVPPLGLNDGGGFVSDNGDWALTDVVVVGTVADCPTRSWK